MDQNLIAKRNEGHRAVLDTDDEVPQKAHASIGINLEPFLLTKETYHYV